MVKQILTGCVLLSCAFSLNAQVSLHKNLEQGHSAITTISDENTDATSCEDSAQASGTLDESGLFIPESLDIEVDKLLNSWHVKYYTRNREDCNSDKNIATSDAVVMERLSRLPSMIELSYNDEVRKCIDLYVDRRRTLVSYMLGLANFYFPMIEQALDENNLPLELKYLVVVESALNPTAVSRAGATGLWQFMLPTGKVYGLEINSLIDERRDPVKATYAACRYFKDMYAIYGDWNLVIAAYNCGPGNVNKAIRKAGGKTDYWAIYNYLPRETRSYVPLFIAATYAMNYHCEHNICSVETELPLSTDTVMINKPLHFDQVAALLKIDKEQLKALNPQYKRDIIPGHAYPCPLLLPAQQAYAFSGMGDSVYNYRVDEFFANRAQTAPGKGDVHTKGSADTQERITHKVKSGETLGGVSSRYGVTMAQVKKWNKLRSNKLPTGKNLVIYVDNGGFAFAEKAEADDEPAPKTVANKKESTTASKTVAASDTHLNQSDKYHRYKVRSGDSFYTIAQKYPGYSATDLMRINNMKSSALKVGQTIKVPAV